MEKPLYISESKRWRGLTVYCNKCKRDINEICLLNGEKIKQCDYSNKHVFKVYVQIPNSSQRRTLKLRTRNVDEAIKQAIQFYQEVKSGNHESLESPNSSQELNIPRYIPDVMGRYVSFLKGENVPDHQKKLRSESHVKDIWRSMKLLNSCLIENGYQPKNILIEEINEQHIGCIHRFLLENKKFSPRTYNKFISYYTSLVNWYNKTYDITIKNRFENIERKKVFYHPETITKTEYEDLLEVIKPENGIKIYKNDKKRYIYRKYIKPGIRLGLETGRRMPEIIAFRFSDIESDEEGNLFLKYKDTKLNHIQGNTDERDKIVGYVPITKSLEELLIELGYDDLKNTSEFILAPEITHNRYEVIRNSLSRGFSVYFDQISKRGLRYKCLRKTFITQLTLHMGQNAKVVTGHTNDQTIKTHYLAKKEFAKVAQDFSVFSSTTERKSQLEDERNKKSINQQNKLLDR